MATINQMVRFSFNNYTANTASSSTSSSYDATSTILRDYASIKDGSYKKLLKAYYAKNAANGAEDTSTSTSSDSSRTIMGVKSAAIGLELSADALTTKGSKSLFKQTDITTTDEAGNKTTTKGYDMDAIYKAVKSFVTDYNDTIDEGAEANSNSILKTTLSLTRLSKANMNLLKDVGITVGSNNKLSVDEEKFKDADINKIKTLFNGANSYAATVADKASKLKGAAIVESLKANTYTESASYSNNYSNGYIYNSFF
ncbi:flagellar filament capping protein FliD [Konateibacter massiliensis]|uniref:flagellar filament capping protein FliD n=1 Tax=Konateibacter massiliensis TaxID=2002841 RepID=UPI000C15D2CB|nr:flagellar filament capping protein FliD [Konateibacter massiliensis]